MSGECLEEKTFKRRKCLLLSLPSDLHTLDFELAPLPSQSKTTCLSGSPRGRIYLTLKSLKPKADWSNMYVSTLNELRLFSLIDEGIFFQGSSPKTIFTLYACSVLDLLPFVVFFKLIYYCVYCMCVCVLMPSMGAELQSSHV